MSETNRIEYKQELSREVEIEKEVVAFLNYKEGGIMYIGIDKFGVSLGVSDIDGDILKIKDRLKNNILPSCLGLFDVSVEKRDFKEIIKIVVASGAEKPYYLKKYGMSEKGCFIRTGTAAEPMPQRMIDDLFSRRTRNSKLTGGQASGQAGGQIHKTILTERQKEVFELIKQSPDISRRQLALKLGINESAIQKHIDALKQKRAIVREGETTGFWKILTD